MSTKRVHPTHPAVRAIDDSDHWFETGPELIWNDEKIAVLMVRVGMAQNALVGEMDTASLAITGVRTGARRLRLSLTRLVSSAALVFEAARLAKDNMRELRRLATSAHRPISSSNPGRVCAGKHPASAIITRARNKVGFHGMLTRSAHRLPSGARMRSSFGSKPAATKFRSIGFQRTYSLTCCFPRPTRPIRLRASGPRAWPWLTCLMPST
jgi:hypothetical protein